MVVDMKFQLKYVLAVTFSEKGIFVFIIFVLSLVQFNTEKRKLEIDTLKGIKIDQKMICWMIKSKDDKSYKFMYQSNVVCLLLVSPLSIEP